MRRFVLSLALFSALLAACGGGAVDSTTGGTEPAATASTGSVTEDSAADEAPADEPDTSDQSDDTATVDPPAPPPEPQETDFDGPAAADFTIDLNRTGTFTLSEEARPVYLVFWAEW